MKNYYKLMQTGLYKVTIDRMAMYDKSASHRYAQPTYISNEGKRVTLDDQIPELVVTAISIIAMMEIDRKGYDIVIHNISAIKEIVELIYGHISTCLQYKAESVFQEHYVNVNELAEMEEFMIKIIKANPSTFSELYKQEMLDNLKQHTLSSTFAEDGETSKIDNTLGDLDVFRRITKYNTLDLSISDLINTN